MRACMHAPPTRPSQPWCGLPDCSQWARPFFFYMLLRSFCHSLDCRSMQLIPFWLPADKFVPKPFRPLLSSNKWQIIKRDGFLKKRRRRTASVFLQWPDYITFFPYLQFRVVDTLKSPSLNPCDLLSLTIFFNLFSVILLPSASRSPCVFPQCTGCLHHSISCGRPSRQGEGQCETNREFKCRGERWAQVSSDGNALEMRDGVS